ncbi:2-amino-4-hydroxy-6-hydroxymethyldihydropteridine diphosphokinase [Legionella micdadei]|uniref:2-amino-4-hydroxy-6-hydroxymethyldihydropteridine pyrophosphokinase n=1 Tax=Legionella micdadei TaxID=451 RepID=A0A098GEA2_LEGMI|nr:2-amino-4-hydroxy-6-hydroxymethyldihydropteridine diphosphokinase [Legionella micdadei]ARG97624.1 2-amino-4-hydroxy-6-hydroxymethyldihydropteridine diphosphokinase [Legionella micdadei]ARH00062.1 2-amino-4-hydroxy-6-hydroxymethyldihydropteridine diphosphokinase [Legionella micdadei]KTD27711.1 2-amino-4-hydroxy-6- hydroxymethyldihydropteridine pyrophosphokinase [Legionella micdadei]NSL17696.1 2-amino-4-hydroxy-6-hydroxymethyldihydropteridine diphosphokinase [Legionella micdadei]CEG60803.1 2-
MTLCYLGLGSNLNSPARQLRRAINALRRLPDSCITQEASFYWSEAWGRKAQPKFCNTVVALQTRLSPQRLLDCCHQIEQQQQRIRKIKWGARTLDIDILLYGSQKIDTLTLKVPHPRIIERDFVLLPLLEIAPSLTIDGLNLSSLVLNKPCSTHKVRV